MSSRRTLVGGIAMLALAILSAPAPAQECLSDGPRHLTPGSVLIFPLFDSRPGFNTVITVTNINTDKSFCENSFTDETGDVSVHYTYVDGETWEESDRFEQLSPADTLAVLARGHDKEQKKGWLWVEATDIDEDTRAIDFDYLIGSAIVVSSDLDFEWEYAPFTFRSLVEETGTGTEQGTCGFYFLDDPFDDNDPDTMFANFDGEELDFFPETLYIDQFFGEGTPPEVGRTFSNTLFLMSARAQGTDLSVLIWNNNEVKCSRTFPFDCWTEVALSEISNCALEDNLRDKYDPSELKGIPYGWVSFNSNDGILGCFVQMISNGGGNALAAGDALHYSGFRDDVTLPRFKF